MKLCEAKRRQKPASDMTGVSNHFRLDINALRAFAVIAVVGFHFQVPGFASGFTGVDIFLVITGYLMTDKVIRDLAHGQFYYWRFVEMRLRRIYPALAIMTIFALIAGWFLTPPSEYKKHMLQAISALTFVSNFAFSDSNGYFAMVAQTKPLLHTWSLSVEWQFYAWMPLVVWLIWRSVQEPHALTLTLAAFICTIVLSFAWCILQSKTDSSGAFFFSLRSRAWEPLIGGAIALREYQLKDQKLKPRPLLAIIGAAIVSACTIYPFPERSWPDAYAALPVVGAALIVMSRINDEMWLLRSVAIQRIGDWSYSIYLWHWPIWVFGLQLCSRHAVEIGPMQTAAAIALSLIVGACSYTCVEQPFRVHRRLWTSHRLAAGAAATTLAVTLYVAGGFVTGGFSGRMPTYVLAAEAARNTNTPRDECFRNSNSEKRLSETYCRFGAAGVAPSMILWGDSFANQYLEPISIAAEDNGVAGLIATQSACRALLPSAKSDAISLACASFNKETLAYISSINGPQIVVIGGNWIDGVEVGKLVDNLLSAKKTVILIMPLLDIGFDVPGRWMDNQIRQGHPINEWQVEATPSLTKQSLREEIQKALASIKTDRVVMVEPASTICEANKCYLVRNGRVNFRDTTHISNLNASQYTEIFDRAIRKAVSKLQGS